MAYPTFTMCGGELRSLVVQVAADQQQYLSGRVGHLSLVAGDGAGEDVVDDHRRNRCDQAQGGGQQGFGDAGATTARLVVWVLAMPMKLFMMPHTVPNRPTNGAVEPMVASTPVPLLMVRPLAATRRSEAEADAFLDAFFFAGVGRQAHLFEGVVHQDWPGCLPSETSLASLRLTERFRGDFTTQATLGAHQLEAFGDPDGPGDDRGDGQADHHDFHHHVGVLVHAPWGQVVGHAQVSVGQSTERLRRRSLGSALGRWRPETTGRRDRRSRCGGGGGWPALAHQRTRRQAPAPG
jgi:hypothetical protein